jgi:hypothetical protein
MDHRQVTPDLEKQRSHREGPAWSTFTRQHVAWKAEFDESTGLPHRAFGPAIATAAGTPEARAGEFLREVLASFDLSSLELGPARVSSTAKFHYVRYVQVHAGRPILFSGITIQLDRNGGVVSFGLDVHTDLPEISAYITGVQAAVSAQRGLEDPRSVQVQENAGWLPVSDGTSTRVRPVHRVDVMTRHEGVPGAWMCFVDAVDGTLLLRSDRVRTEDGHPPVAANAIVQGAVHMSNPLVAPVTVGLPNVRLSLNSGDVFTDENGLAETGENGPVVFQVPLAGHWSTVLTFGVTPLISGTLNEGTTTLSFDAFSTLQERSAYYHVNIVHDHMKQLLPDFTDLDWSLPTNVDIFDGTCNAYYDGASINFFAEGDGCYSLATVGDVVYHEYGHGINDWYYQSQGTTFMNGAMHEGYADVWGFSITQDPVLARGWEIGDPGSFIRRYDQDRKVFPMDITGESHADGEIIAGAWWDTYLLLGNDMDLLMELFAEAYAGLQAEAFDGEEGTAFREVLLDVLLADDDDGNLINGTPHSAAILEGFRLHGITLLTDFDILHTPLESAAEDIPLAITAQADVAPLFQPYVQAMRLTYRVDDGPWQDVAMTTGGGNVYNATIPAQPAGVIVAYHLGLVDINGVVNPVSPPGADGPQPTLPYFILVGYDLLATEDADDMHQLGDWAVGLPTDNAESGRWVRDVPVATYSGFTEATMVQPGFQHTPGGERCFVTGNAFPGETVGANDVDDGRTTLQTGPIDVEDLGLTAVTYERWYTNTGGVSPGLDFWQVMVSDDGQDWVYVENTRTTDRSWRRMAFRVPDHLGEATSLWIRFIASDSSETGGSLVEAAVDDIKLWSSDGSVAVETVPAQASGLAIWPSPATDGVDVHLPADVSGPARLNVLDPTGRLIRSQRTRVSAGSPLHVDLAGVPSGTYILQFMWEDGRLEERFSVVR